MRKAFFCTGQTGLNVPAATAKKPSRSQSTSGPSLTLFVSANDRQWCAQPKRRLQNGNQLASQLVGFVKHDMRN